VKDPEPEEGETVALMLPSVKILLCYESEFSRPITAMRREGNTLSPLLRSAWDSQPLEVLTRGKSRMKASNAHVSIVAHVTPEELRKLLDGSVEVANGFSNRFLWARVFLAPPPVEHELVRNSLFCALRSQLVHLECVPSKNVCARN
jgi:hypothetical protein